MNKVLLRFKALLYDYIIILFYLLILLGVSIGLYFLIFGTIPEFNHLESQLIAFLTTVLPITIFFTITESKYPYASYGKRKAGLVIKYQSNPITGSIIRNILKFLPWQIAHYAVIKGLYQGFNIPLVIVTYIISISLPIIYIIMVIFNKDGRHLPDIISRSIVIKKE